MFTVMLHGASVFLYCPGVGWRFCTTGDDLCHSVLDGCVMVSFESALGYGMAGLFRRDTLFAHAAWRWC